MNPAEWKIEHSCPQCGAPMAFGEMDSLLACAYCRTRFQLSRDRPPMYYIPAPDPGIKGLFYAPYWRFRGMIFKCPPYKIVFNMLDASILAGGPPELPGSLGVRPQALKLKILSPASPGCFLPPDFDRKTALEKIQDRLVSLGVWPAEEKTFLKEYIGETASLIYAPFYSDHNKFFDALLGKPLAEIGPGGPGGGSPGLNPSGQIHFLPALCPNCGGDLKGGQKSLIVFCRNCRTAWESGPHGFLRRPYLLLEGPDRPDVHLPFWRIKAEVKGLELKTFADLIRIANLPKVVQPEMKGWDWFFFTPAFSLPGTLFLRMARNATVSQPHRYEEGQTPKNAADASISAGEAARSLKIVLANLIVAKRIVFPRLPEVVMATREAVLVYIPFRIMGPELVNQGLQLSVNREVVTRTPQ
ncbi:MAG: hypothetical protein V1816_00110 [Pseudomonadota bacterium]